MTDVWVCGRLSSNEILSVSAVELVGVRMLVEGKTSSLLGKRGEEEAPRTPGPSRAQGVKMTSLWPRVVELQEAGPLS